MVVLMAIPLAQACTGLSIAFSSEGMLSSCEMEEYVLEIVPEQGESVSTEASEELEAPQVIEGDGYYEVDIEEGGYYNFE